MNRELLIILVGFGLISGVVYTQRASTFLMEQLAEQRIGHSLLTDLEDGLHVILYGAGGPHARPITFRTLMAVLLVSPTIRK